MRHDRSSFLLSWCFPFLLFFPYLSALLQSFHSFTHFIPSFNRFIPSGIPAFPSLFLLSVPCFLIFHFAFFTYVRVLTSLFLSCRLYLCSPAAFTSARLLPLLLLACFGSLLCGFVKWFVVDSENLYLQINAFLKTTWRHTWPF